MPTPTTTCWKLQPHTEAKHKILKYYLDAWLPILTRYNSKVIFIDGFAGPGRYVGGEPGSPIIALEALVKHPGIKSRAAEIEVICIEEKADRCAALKEEVESLKAESSFPKTIRPDVRCGSFAKETRDLLGEGRFEGVPVFAFIDPFGFAGVPMSLIRDLAQRPRCECLVNFAYESVNRFLNHPNEAILSNFDELFATHEWTAVGELDDPDERRDALITLYSRQLKQVAGFKYVLTFEMINEGARTEYFLVFATRSHDGLSKMKSAVWRIDPDRGSMFSDKVHASPMMLMRLDGGSGLKEVLLRKFARQGRVRIDEIERYVLEETPYSETMHLKKKSLMPLEREQRIKVGRPAGKRNRVGEYPPGTLIEFVG